MVRYRLYRSIVAGATGRVGDALTRQLLLSPLCSEVHAVSRAEVHGFDGLAAAAAKLRQHRADFAAPLCGLDASALRGADAAFCVLGARAGWSDTADVAAAELGAAVRFAELCAEAGVPHLSLLSSAWAGARPAFARLQQEAQDAFAALGASGRVRRVSVFRPAVLVDADGQPLTPPGAPAWAGAAHGLLPTAAQFLPTRFRQVALSDVALAMRLNVELCDATGPVETLDYKDMMQIIGREGEV